MKYDPFKHHRRSIRLKGYDYSQAGAYFVTICVQNHECLFGEIIDGEMHMNEAGQMILRWWNELLNKYPSIETDEFIVMPNHLHGVVVITVGATLGGRPDPYGHPEIGQPHRAAPTKPTLGDVMDWFKTMTTNAYIRGVKQQGWQPFSKRFLQRDYYEHIIRNEREGDAIREYIRNNPMRWSLDSDNPANCEPQRLSKIAEDYWRDAGLAL